MAKGKAEARPTTKSESMALIAEKTGLTRKQVAGVLEALTGIMARDLKKFGPTRSRGSRRSRSLRSLPRRRARASTPSPRKR